MKRIKLYYLLTKPERTLTNVLTAAAGFFFAARLPFNWLLFIVLIVGTTLVIASGCVLNNYIDKDLDKKMARTKKRALVQGDISPRAALYYAICLGAFGFFLLSYINWLTFGVGVVAFIGYVGLYGLAKRLSVHGTLVGTLPGGASLVAGYTAVTDRLDGAALMLFILMATWQMAHFYAIAVYRLEDYRNAEVPVWSVKKGIPSTKRQILLYALLFLLAIILLVLLGYVGYIFLVVMGSLSLYWLWLIFEGFQHPDANKWAQQVFSFSLVVMVALSGMLAVGPHIP